MALDIVLQLQTSLSALLLSPEVHVSISSWLQGRYRYMMMPLRNRHITQSVRCVRADTYWPHTLYLPWGGAEGGRGGGGTEREGREKTENASESERAGPREGERGRGGGRERGMREGERERGRESAREREGGGRGGRDDLFLLRCTCAAAG
jgi:hypothetical protein